MSKLILSDIELMNDLEVSVPVNIVDKNNDSTTEDLVMEIVNNIINDTKPQLENKYIPEKVSINYIDKDNNLCIFEINKNLINYIDYMSETLNNFKMKGFIDKLFYTYQNFKQKRWYG